MNQDFEVIIIGGSYSGLSAALALGRASIKTLVIDSGNPCNAPTPHSHNFLTQDGKTPAEIGSVAKEQVLKYPSVKFIKALAVDAKKIENGFEVYTANESYSSQEIIFASGIKDIMPEINNFKECWGKSIIHCPYCHGYEFKQKKTVILGNSEYAFEFSKMLLNWTSDLSIVTNGPKDFNDEELNFFAKHKIQLVEKTVKSINQAAGQIQELVFEDDSKMELAAMYARLEFEQKTDIPFKLACDIDESGY